MLLNNYTGHVVFPLNVTEDRPLGPLTFKEKLHIIKVSAFLFTSDLGVSVCVWLHCRCCVQGLLGFVVPLGLVYFAEYFINQGMVSSLVPSGLTFISLHSVKSNPASLW